MPNLFSVAALSGFPLHRQSGQYFPLSAYTMGKKKKPRRQSKTNLPLSRRVRLKHKHRRGNLSESNRQMAFAVNVLIRVKLVPGKRWWQAGRRHGKGLN